MSEKAIAALGKLVPAPSTKNYQFYQAHYELIRDEITRLQSEVERLRGRCGELEADANRFKFIERRESHQSMAMVNYEIACISGENPTEDQFREAVDEAMESAHRMSPQGAAPDMGGEK